MSGWTPAGTGANPDRSQVNATSSNRPNGSAGCSTGSPLGWSRSGSPRSRALHPAGRRYELGVVRCQAARHIWTSSSARPMPCGTGVRFGLGSEGQEARTLEGPQLLPVARMRPTPPQPVPRRRWSAARTCTYAIHPRVERWKRKKLTGAERGMVVWVELDEASPQWPPATDGRGLPFLVALDAARSLGLDGAAGASTTLPLRAPGIPRPDRRVELTRLDLGGRHRSS